MRGHIDISRYAAEFEKLAIEYLSGELGVASDHVQPESVFPIDGARVLMFHASADPDATSRTLVAPRLTEKDLGEPVVSGIVVISINRSPHAVYVVSSSGFESAAMRQLVLVKARGAKVLLVNGATLADWVRRMRKSLRDVDPELLDYVIATMPAAAPRGILTVDARAETPVAAGISTITAPVRYGVHFDGEEERGQLVVLGPSERPQLPPLIGEARHTALAEMASRVDERPGIGVLTGGAGVGKSTFVAHLRQELVGREIASTVIDLTGITSRRVYFLRVLSALTGADLETFAAGADVDAVAALLGPATDERSEQQRDAVAHVLAGTMAAFEEKSDVNVSLVNRFIGSLASRAGKRELFVFQNLERSVREVLDILPETARALESAGASTIFEVRRFGEAGTGSAEQLLRGLLSAREWDVVLERLGEASSYPPAEIMPLSPAEALDYVESLLPGFGPERGTIIVNAVGTNPLFLGSAVAAMQRSGVLAGPAHAAVIARVEQFFLDITPGDATAILHRHIGLWWQELRDVMAATTLTDGRLNFATLGMLRPQARPSDTATALVGTRLFVSDAGRPDVVHIVHGVFSRELRRIVDGKVTQFADGRIALYDAVQPLLDRVETVLESSDEALQKRPFFLAAAGKWDAVAAAVEPAHERATERRQWADVTELDLLAYRAIPFRTGTSEEERSRQRVSVLLDLLGSERERDRLALDVNRPFIEQLGRDVRADPQFDTNRELHYSKVRALHLETRHHFIREEFDRAYDAAKLGSDLGWQWRDDIGQRLCARMFVDCALALKGLERRGESVELFDDACERMSGNQLLLNERLSNYAALELLHDPKKARERYIEILASDEKDADPAEHLHTQVDLAMADFLDHEYERAEEHARRVLSLAIERKENAQIARARNIIGCVEWTRGDLLSADASFEAASIAAERTLVNRYLWRMRVNRAGTALARGLNDLALTLARTGARMILEPRRWAARNIATHPEHRKSRWYAGLIAAGVYISQIDADEFDRYIADAAIQTLRDDCIDAATGTYACPAFIGTTHVHAGRIMLT